MSEFVNVTEVEKLPINKIDSLIAIDANKNIKRTSITVEQEIDADSTNPISSKGVYDAIDEVRGDVGAVIDDINTELTDLDGDITDIRDEIITLNDKLDDYATKEWVGNEIQEAIQGGVDLTNYYTKAEVDSKIAEIPTPDLTAYATTAYVDGLIGDINSVLDEINGEVV